MGKRIIPWTEQENSLIKELYQDTDREILLEKIERTWKAIRCQAAKLGVQRSPEIIKKDNVRFTKKAMLEKYGVEYSTLLPSMKEKTRQTNLKLRGVEYPTQSKEVRDKVKETVQEKYGVDNVFQATEIKDKITKTLIETYGVTNPLKNKDIQDKVKRTNIEKYGVENPFQLIDHVKKGMLNKYGEKIPLRIPAIMDKKKKTSLEKYGYDVASKNIAVRKKLSETLSTESVKKKKYYTLKKNKENFNISHEEKDFLSFLQNIDPDIRHQQLHPTINHVIDFYSPRYDLWIQYDGIYWHGKNYKKGNNPQSDSIEKIIDRDAFQNEKIPNLIRFWSDDVLKAIKENKINSLIENRIKEKIPSFSSPLICHQYLKKIEYRTEDLKELPFNPSTLKASDFILSFEDMSPEIVDFIVRYEWLGTIGNPPKWCFTARYRDKLGGVVLLNEPYSYSTILGKDTPIYEALIQRGATASWTPKNLGSRLIMFSCRWMVQHTDKRAFIGYADPSAKEVGIIYQACSFDYIGGAFGARYIYEHKDINRRFTAQYLRKTSSFKKWCTKNDIVPQKEWFKENGFKNLKEIPATIKEKWLNWNKKIISESNKIPMDMKMKYVLVLPKNNKERKKLKSIKTYESLPYPKSCSILHPNSTYLNYKKSNYGKTANRKNPEKIRYIIENHSKMSRLELAKNINETLRWTKRQIMILIKNDMIKPKR